ncbi:MAG: alpha/beta hydrolase family protein [Candidatus Rokuibacteriota bacterium]
MRRTRRYVLGLAVVGGLTALWLALRFGPTFAFSLALAVPGAEPWLAGLAERPVHEPITLPGAARPLDADLYRPAQPRSALLLVHGLSRAGRRHPELGRLARLLAERGHVVLVPHFEGLAAFRLSGREVEEIGVALRHLGRSSPRVGILGFSFGAGPALLAASRHPDLHVVGSFGGYADLRHVIAYITTGVHTFDGRRYVLRQEEYNRWKLLALLAEFMEHARDRALLETIAERKLANSREPTASLEAALGDDGQAMLALALNRREDAVTPLLARLPRSARQALDDLSPLRVVPRLPGRLLIAHGTGDASIPFTESLRLAEAAGGRARTAILRTFHHTGPQPLWESLSRRTRDGFDLFRLADDLLAR